MRKIGQKRITEEYRKQAVNLLEKLKCFKINKFNRQFASLYVKKTHGKTNFTTFADYWKFPEAKTGHGFASSSSTGWRLIASSAFNPLHFNKETVDYKLFRNKKTL
jgi:hypothetical protein